MFNLGGLIAGSIISVQLSLFLKSPWAIALYPGILSMRGVINGVFSGRLSTGLHIGTINPSFKDNTDEFKELWLALIVLTLISSLLMSVTVFTLTSLLIEFNVVYAFNAVMVSTATMCLSLAIGSPLTVAVSIFSFKSGLDPDFIVYPVMSTTMDVVITLLYFLILRVFSIFKAFLAVLDLSFALVVIAIIVLNRRKPVFKSTISCLLYTSPSPRDRG